MIVQHYTGEVHICDFCGMSSLGDVKMTVKESAVICEPCAIEAVKCMQAAPAKPTTTEGAR